MTVFSCTYHNSKLVKRGTQNLVRYFVAWPVLLIISSFYEIIDRHWNILTTVVSDLLDQVTLLRTKTHFKTNVERDTQATGMSSYEPCSSNFRKMDKWVHTTTPGPLGPFWPWNTKIDVLTVGQGRTNNKLFVVLKYDYLCQILCSIINI